MAHIHSIMTDLEKEQKGVWVNFAEGIRLKIARAGNPDYNKLLRELSKPYIKEIREGTADDNVNKDILMKVRSETILLGWENLDGDEGAILYSAQTAYEFFKDPSLKDFYNFVIIESENMDLFRMTITEASVKNSAASSTTVSTGGATKKDSKLKE